MNTSDQITLLNSLSGKTARDIITALDGRKIQNLDADVTVGDTGKRKWNLINIGCGMGSSFIAISRIGIDMSFNQHSNRITLDKTLHFSNVRKNKFLSNPDD